MAHRPSLLATFAALAVLAGGMAAVGGDRALAQVFGPPMTVFGSVTDEAGQVPADLVVEAFVGNKVCGRGLTQFTGEGSGRVTVYYADVHSREQTSECGAPGVEVRIKIGERFAEQTTQWRAGPVEMHITFGDVTPAPIPTFTPTPRATTPGATEPSGAGTPTPQGPATATATVALSASPSPTTTATRTATATQTPTLAGGLATREVVSTTSSGGGASDDGFPVWAAVVIGVGVIVALGGGIGFLMARSRSEEDEGEA